MRILLGTRGRRRPSTGLITRLISTAMLLISACGSPASQNPSPSPKGDSLTWKKCGAIECTMLEVPFDYSAPSRGSFQLPLTRLRAADDDQRIGVLLVNPGGPGAPGTSLAQNAAYYFSPAVMAHFDIIGWDPRGTGASQPAIDCIDDIDGFFGAPRSKLTTEKFIEGCSARSGEILQYVSTESSAQDINTIREALEEKTISYFGFSYGGALGARWAALFPTTVRAAVFDGAPHPTASAMQRRLAQSRGFETQFTKFLLWNNLTSEFDTLMKKVNISPIRTSNGRTSITSTVLMTAVASSMYDDSSWPQLASAIRTVTRGDGTEVLALFDTYYYQDKGFEDYKNVAEAAIAIACVDDIDRPTTSEVDASIENFMTEAPRLGELFARDYSCALWPAKPRHVTASTTPPTTAPTTSLAPPMRVLGSTGDPATPIEASRAMAKELHDSILVEVSADRHTSYLKNSCATKIADEYLVNLTLGGKAVQELSSSSTQRINYCPSN